MLSIRNKGLHKTLFHNHSSASRHVMCTIFAKAKQIVEYVMKCYCIKLCDPDSLTLSCMLP